MDNGQLLSSKYIFKENFNQNVRSLYNQLLKFWIVLTNQIFFVALNFWHCKLKSLSAQDTFDFKMSDFLNFHAWYYNNEHFEYASFGIESSLPCFKTSIRLHKCTHCKILKASRFSMSISFKTCDSLVFLESLKR